MNAAGNVGGLVTWRLVDGQAQDAVGGPLALTLSVGRAAVSVGLERGQLRDDAAALDAVLAAVMQFKKTLELLSNEEGAELLTSIATAANNAAPADADRLEDAADSWNGKISPRARDQWVMRADGGTPFIKHKPFPTAWPGANAPAWLRS